MGFLTVEASANEITPIAVTLICDMQVNNFATFKSIYNGLLTHGASSSDAFHVQLLPGTSRAEMRIRVRVESNDPDFVSYSSAERAFLALVNKFTKSPTKEDSLTEKQKESRPEPVEKQLVTDSEGRPQIKTTATYTFAIDMSSLETKDDAFAYENTASTFQEIIDGLAKNNNHDVQILQAPDKEDSEIIVAVKGNSAKYAEGVLRDMIYNKTRHTQQGSKRVPTGGTLEQDRSTFHAHKEPANMRYKYKTNDQKLENIYQDNGESMFRNHKQWFESFKKALDLVGRLKSKAIQNYAASGKDANTSNELSAKYTKALYGATGNFAYTAAKGKAQEVAFFMQIVNYLMEDANPSNIREFLKGWFIYQGKSAIQSGNSFNDPGAPKDIDPDKLAIESFARIQVMQKQWGDKLSRWRAAYSEAQETLKEAESQAKREAGHENALKAAKKKMAEVTDLIHTVIKDHVNDFLYPDDTSVEAVLNDVIATDAKLEKANRKPDDIAEEETEEAKLSPIIDKENQWKKIEPELKAELRKEHGMAISRGEEDQFYQSKYMGVYSDFLKSVLGKDPTWEDVNSAFAEVPKKLQEEKDKIHETIPTENIKVPSKLTDIHFQGMGLMAERAKSVPAIDDKVGKVTIEGWAEPDLSLESVEKRVQDYRNALAAEERKEQEAIKNGTEYTKQKVKAPDMYTCMLYSIFAPVADQVGFEEAARDFTNFDKQMKDNTKPIDVNMLREINTLESGNYADRALRMFDTVVDQASAIGGGQIPGFTTRLINAENLPIDERIELKQEIIRQLTDHLNLIEEAYKDAEPTKEGKIKYSARTKRQLGDQKISDKAFMDHVSIWLGNLQQSIKEDEAIKEGKSVDKPVLNQPYGMSEQDKEKDKAQILAEYAEFLEPLSTIVDNYKDDQELDEQGKMEFENDLIQFKKALGKALLYKYDSAAVANTVKSVAMEKAKQMAELKKRFSTPEEKPAVPAIDSGLPDDSKTPGEAGTIEQFREVEQSNITQPEQNK